MSRRVLITGAGGFVGSHLAEGFARLGDAVTALDRRFDVPTQQRLLDVECVEAPLEAATLQGLGHFDLVIHGAALTTAPEVLGISDTAHIRSNLNLLLDCLDFAQGCGANHFVFISSSGVFAEDEAPVLLESTPARSRAPYAIAKRSGELIVEAAANAQFTALSIRLGPVFGPHEVSRDTRVNVSQVRRWLDAAQAGQPIVVRSPETRRDWTYAPDLAPALDAVLRQGLALTGVLHFTSAQILHEAELAQAVADLVPGASFSIAPDGGPQRLPMASERIDMPKLYPWTTLRAGVSEILEVEARA